MDELQDIKARIQDINNKIMNLLNERYALEEDMRMLIQNKEGELERRDPCRISVNELVEALPSRHQSDVMREMVKKGIVNLEQLIKSGVLNSLDLKPHVYSVVKETLWRRFRVIPLS